MKKEYRLKNNIEIGKIVNKRQRIYSSLYNLYYITNQENTKIAIVAGKKCGDAVSRNYQKRIMREVVRPYISNILNIHAVIIAKDKTINASFIEKKKELEKIIKILIERNN